MPREFQHPFHKMPWLLEEDYDSLDDLEFIDGRMYVQGERVLPLWADDDDEAHRSHRRSYNDISDADECAEVVAPLIDPRRAVLLPGYTYDHLPVWQRPDPPQYVNGASRTSDVKKEKYDVPKIVETQSPTDSDAALGEDDGAKPIPERSKSRARKSFDSLRRSSTLTRINELLQRARSEVLEGEDAMNARNRIRHLLRNSHPDDTQR
ncbi:uncharacterized protein [Panulirus ornatus]|uniref:uncharacterized protein n=1 Tax=Panulirus ornatus TaxID=150431 RepID=UPI003A890419